MRRRVRYTDGMTKTQLFITNVNAFIEADRLSVSEIARRAGVNRSELSDLLGGKQGVTIDRADKIAGAIGMPLDMLIAGPLKLAATGG